MNSILQELNEEQLEAVTTTEGYVRIIAGAGSGKTKALTHRYAYLVNNLGISTSNILCVTFTNKAANEMKKRIRDLIGDLDTGYVCTFHGMGVQILREDIHAINYPQNFVVLDSEDQESILKSVYQTCNIMSKTYTFNMARKDITLFKTHFCHIPYLIDLDSTKLKKEYENENDVKKKIILGYLYEQKKCFGLDYDDLITISLHILLTVEEKRKKWQRRMMYIMVDEFQDVSALNYKMAEILSDYHKNLFVVGDPDQTIYSWRGANVEFILNFDKFHQDTKTIILNKNYRSSQNILNAANSLIKRNKHRIDKDLVAIKEKNVRTTYFHAKTTQLEAEWIGKQIKKLIEKGESYNKIAILYRSHFVSRSIEELFIKEQIPYILYSGVEFYKRKEIKDVLSYLRMIVYADDLSFLRVVNEPKRYVGRTRINFLREYSEQNNCSLYNSLLNNMGHKLIINTDAKQFVNLVEKYSKLYKEMRLSDLLSSILDESGYEAMLRLQGEQERLDNLSELKQSVFDFEKTSGEENTLEEYLQNVALFTNMDKIEKKESVKMMTVHAAKGLEFPYVFLCELNEGIFPTSHTNTLEKLEEERRLAYVAYTRAENALFLSDAEGTNSDKSYRFPSRFIFNTDKEFLDYESELEEMFEENARLYIENNEKKLNGNNLNEMLKVGDLIEHDVFGTGRIVGVWIKKQSYVIKFDKFKTVRNISFQISLKKLK